MIDLASSESNLLRKKFLDVFILTAKVLDRNVSEEYSQELSIELIITMVERHPNLFQDDLIKLDLYIEYLIKYSFTINDQIDDEWNFPSCEFFIDEDAIPESKLEMAICIIERLCACLSKDLVLRKLSSSVQDILMNNSDPKSRYIAFTYVSSIIEQVNSLSEVQAIFQPVFDNIISSNPKVIFSCLQCIECALYRFNPDFHIFYSDQVLQILMNLLKDTSSLRNQLQACECLSSYLSVSSNNIITCEVENNTKQILDNLFSIFMSDAHLCLKNSIINVISKLIELYGKTVREFSQQLIKMLIEYLSNVVEKKICRSIYGSLIILIQKINDQYSLGEYFETFLENIISITKMIKNYDDKKGVSTFINEKLIVDIFMTWEKILHQVKTMSPTYGISITEESIKLLGACVAKIEKQNEVLLAPTLELNINKRDANNIHITNGKHTNSGKDEWYKQFEIESSIYLKFFKSVINYFSESFLQQLEKAEQNIFQIILQEVSPRLRLESSSSLAIIYQSITNFEKKMYFQDVSKTESLPSKVYAIKYTSILIKALDNELNKKCLAAYFDTMGNIALNAGIFLQSKEILMLFSKLIEIFDKIEKSRFDLNKRKDKLKEELEHYYNNDDKINSDDEEENDYSDILNEMETEISEVEDVLTALCNFMGSIFKTHKKFAVESATRLLYDLLPKYLQPNSSEFELKLALQIINHMIEFLGEQLLVDIWPELGKLLLSHLNHRSNKIKQTVLYGLGEYASGTAKNFKQISKDIISQITKTAKINQFDPLTKEVYITKDHSTCVFGKIIKYQNNIINTDELVDIWLSGLPIEFLSNEAIKQHNLLIDLLLNEADLVIGRDKRNLSRVILLLIRIYKSDVSDDGLNNQIKNLLEGMKMNNFFKPYIQELMTKSDEGLKDKLTDLFN